MSEQYDRMIKQERSQGNGERIEIDELRDLEDRVEEVKGKELSSEDLQFALNYAAFYGTK